MRLVRFYIIAIMLLVTGIIHATNTGDVLVVELNDERSTVQHFYLSDTPNLVFGLDVITVETEDMSTTFEYGEIKQIYITRLESEQDVDPDIPTSLEEPQQKIFKFQYVDGQTIRIDGVDRNTSIGLYAIDGKNVPMTAERSDDGIVISLSSLQRGFYVIKCNSQSFKVYKK